MSAEEVISRRFQAAGANHPRYGTRFLSLLALTALKAAGYAVVELPKPNERGAWHIDERCIWLDARGPGGVRTLGDTWVADPRAVAAALLAAADAAEAAS